MLEWVVGLNTYLRGTLDEKIACKTFSFRFDLIEKCFVLVAFNCYSLKGEKHITREEIFQLLKSSVMKVNIFSCSIRFEEEFSSFSKRATKILMKVSKN